MTLVFKLRDYQLECVNRILSDLRLGEDRILISLPVGSGKTVIFSHLIQVLKEIKPDIRILILVPKNILIEQTEIKVDGACVYNSELNRREIGQVTLASVQSFWKLKEFFNVCVIDETHRWSKYHDETIKNINNPKLKIIGFTGTPFTGQGVPIYGPEQKFKKINYTKSMKWMTEQENLVPVVYQETRLKVDLSNVSITAGDYNQKESSLIMMSKVAELTSEALRRSSERKKIIWLCCSIEHAEETASLIDGAVLYHSGMTKEDRVRSIESDWRHLISVLAISEGFDYPAVDCVVVMRPTRSPVLYIQAVGRGLRLHSDKADCLFIDGGRVLENLGSVYDYIPSKKYKPKQGKLCPMCDCVSFSDVCDCGHEFTMMCPVCLNMKKIGAKCCDPKERDMLKNLSFKENWLKVNRYEIKDHVTKKGAKIKKIIYHCGWQTHTEYVNWGVVRPAKEILIGKKNGFTSVIEKKF